MIDGYDRTEYLRRIGLGETQDEFNARLKREAPARRAEASRVKAEQDAKRASGEWPPLPLYPSAQYRWDEAEWDQFDQEQEGVRFVRDHEAAYGFKP